MNEAWTYRFEPDGGYDCMTPAVDVLHEGVKSFAIDAKDHGWEHGQGEPYKDQNQADVITDIIVLARAICAALNHEGIQSP